MEAMPGLSSKTSMPTLLLLLLLLLRLREAETRGAQWHETRGAQWQDSPLGLVGPRC